jgi:sporulation protein YlmC with PRC-barrel domain
MASRCDVSFYKDLLHKPVVDCDGHPVGALLDLSAGPINPIHRQPCVTNLVVRPRRSQRQGLANQAGKPLVLPWELVASLEARFIRLRQSTQDLGPATLAANEVLLREHIMDQQIVDCRGLKLQRVNDITMALSDGTLSLWGMDTGIHGFLIRLGFHWGLLSLFRPLFGRLHHRVIEWECVDRLEPARGWIRLRVSRDEVRSNGHKTPLTPEA